MISDCRICAALSCFIVDSKIDTGLCQEAAVSDIVFCCPPGTSFVSPLLKTDVYFERGCPNKLLRANLNISHVPKGTM
jgi:hypothetical protein